MFQDCDMMHGDLNMGNDMKYKNYDVSKFVGDVEVLRLDEEDNFHESIEHLIDYLEDRGDSRDEIQALLEHDYAIDAYDSERVDCLYDEALDCDGTVTVAGIEFWPSEILSACDPIAYRCGRTDYVDSLEWA